MILSDDFFSELFNKLDLNQPLTTLLPKDKGTYLSLKCPKCGIDESAYIYKGSSTIICNRKNKCGISTPIVEYIHESEQISKLDAIRYLAVIANIPMPDLDNIDTLSFEQSRTRERLLTETQNYAIQNLWDDRDKSVLSYLHSRGYEDEAINAMAIGAINNLQDLKLYLLNKKFDPLLVDEHLSSFYSTHPLLIPYYSSYGSLIGFISRAITPNSNKYLNSKGLRTGNHFFNIHNAKKTDTLIIVEGIFDALSLSQKGIQGVVACLGDSPRQEQITDAVKYNPNLKKIILLLDNDTAGKKGTEKAIASLKDNNLRVYVVDIHTVKDPEEFINMDGIESLRKLIDEATSSHVWSVKQILYKHNINTSMGKENALYDILEYLNSISDPLESFKIIEIISQYLGYTKNIIEDKILSFNEKRNLEKSEQEWGKLYQGIGKLINSGQHEKAKEFMRNQLAQINSYSIKNIVLPYSTETAISDIQIRSNGLKTGYPSLDKFVTIQNGAITLVAGRTSHGKTTFLLNLFLNMITNYPKHSFYFFSYEESKTALFVKIITILTNKLVGSEYSNSRDIEDYLKAGKRYDLQINEAINLYNQFVDEGRLWLIDTPLSVDSLAQSLQSLKSSNHVNGVFIDYAQRIKYDGSYDSERIKISRISQTLREVATQLDIPLIVGAQLNRDNVGEVPRLENLKEAGNLEEDANLVLGVHNWKVAVTKDMLKDNENDGNYFKIPKSSRTVNISTRNTSFDVHVLKNRNGTINEVAHLNYDAPILKISEMIQLDTYRDRIQ